MLVYFLDGMKQYQITKNAFPYDKKDCKIFVNIFFDMFYF